ncbi:hypothetical protein [Gallaecimonas pentaromativorans]|uniref:hypothetical protein n=1 Tax=Gallaecimonas pentaromativorans TaxID=584787 RepID=UPI0011CE93D5|nr:hypothetical protein [Gallaecimonas pentaromativorans]
MNRFLLLISVLLSFPSSANEEYGKVVATVGVQTTSIGYFRIEGGFATNCSSGVMYFDTSTDFGRSALTTILSAKMAGKKLSRIVYVQNEVSKSCNLTLVEVEA